MENKKYVRYVRAGDVKSHGDKGERNKRIVKEAKPLPSSKQLAAPGCYWFVTTEELDDMRYNDKLFAWKEQTETEDPDCVVHFLYRVDFKAKEHGTIVLEFKDGTTVQVEGVPSRDILLKNIGATSPLQEPFDLKDLLRKLPPKDVVVINTLLFVPDEPDYIQLAETALVTIGFKKEVSAPNRQYLYSHVDLINSRRHVLLIPFGDHKRYLQIEDYLPQASEALLLVETKGEKQSHEFMAIKQVNNSAVINNTNTDNTWEFVVKTANFGLVDLTYDKLETPVKLLLSISKLRGLLGGVSCQNATIKELQPQFSRFILEWTLAPSEVKPLHPQEIYLCFKFEPDLVQAFTEYAAIILAALDIEYEYVPVIVHGSVLVYIRCPSYLQWYIIQRKEDIFKTLSDYKLTEIYEAFISDVDASMSRPENKEFVDELTFLKELMMEDNIAEQPTFKRFKVTSSIQMPSTVDQLSTEQKWILEWKYNSRKSFDNKLPSTIESIYNSDELRQQLFNFKTDKNARIAVRLFLASTSAGLATNVAKVMRPFDGKSIVDGVHSGLQIANTIIEWNQSGIVHIGELKYGNAVAVLFDVKDSVWFDFNEETAQKMINFIQKWNIERQYSTEEFNSHRFVRDFLQYTMGVSLLDRFKGPLGLYMDYVMRTGDVTPRLFSSKHGMMVFKTHKELEDADLTILRSKLSEDELKLLKIFHRGFQLQEAASGKDVSSCCYGLPTNGLEIVNEGGILNH